jgi:purine catabolism regulator
MPLVGTVAFAAVALVSSGRGGDAVAAAADIAAAAIGRASCAARARPSTTGRRWCARR